MSGWGTETSIRLLSGTVKVHKELVKCVCQKSASSKMMVSDSIPCLAIAWETVINRCYTDNNNGQLLTFWGIPNQAKNF